jgi:hypothetical protein
MNSISSEERQALHQLCVDLSDSEVQALKDILRETLEAEHARTFRSPQSFSSKGHVSRRLLRELREQNS